MLITQLLSIPLSVFCPRFPVFFFRFLIFFSYFGSFSNIFYCGREVEAGTGLHASCCRADASKVRKKPGMPPIGAMARSSNRHLGSSFFFPKSEGSLRRSKLQAHEVCILGQYTEIRLSAAVAYTRTRGHVTFRAEKCILSSTKHLKLQKRFACGEKSRKIAKTQQKRVRRGTQRHFS